MAFKPKHQGGYTSTHTALCERTLVSLLRGFGPWKRTIYLAGGLVPRYLFAGAGHPGTADIDLILDLTLMESVEAYQRLEQNLEALGFVRGRNDEG